MAAAIIRDLDFPRHGSSIRIEPIVGGDHKVHVAGGKLSELKWQDDKVEFLWQAESLPWVLPDDAQLGAKLTQLGRQLGRESLEVHGFSVGDYQLLIDGQEVGRYSNVKLERQFELQDNPRTPQYQQALAIAQLNKHRNEGPVSALRDEWWDFQDYVDAKRDAAQHPDNAQAKETLSKTAQKIVGMDVRVAQHNADAKAIEDDIFTKNNPLARKYTLVKIGSQRK